MKKKLIVLAHVFPKFKTVKDLVRPLSNKVRFRTSFDSQHVKESQTLVKYAWEHVYHILCLLGGGLIWKTSPLVIFEILRVFVNILIADDKYPVLSCEKLLLLIQIQLPSKWIFLLNFLFRLWNLYQIFNNFKEKVIVIANIFPILQTVKDLVIPLSKKRRFKTFISS